MTRCVLFAEVPGFYAAVARADDPSLAARPVIVGGDPRKRGRVQAATADALTAGVTLEMSVLEALRLCPTARAVRTDMPRYREVSRRLFALLRGIEPNLEGFGMAACYADLGVRAEQSERLSQALLEAVASGLGLPLRVGIGAGKFLARIAAEEVPGGERGVVRVLPGDEARFLAPLPASRIDGVGRKTAAALAAMGGHTIADVVRLGRDRLQAELGPHGLRIHACATGTDGEPVRGASHPKSLSRESTLPAEPLDVGVFSDQLAGLAQQLEEELGRMGLAAGRVTLKIRFHEGTTTTRSATLPRPTAKAAELFRAAQLLLERTPAGARPARGLGIQLALLAPAGEIDPQLDLFSSS